MSVAKIEADNPPTQDSGLEPPETLLPMRLISNHLAGDFVVSSGSTLFRRIRPTPTSPSTTPNAPLELCILHDPKRGRWVLPKGRKDIGEDTASAALRETYEETGWRCTLVPLYAPTRATAPGERAVDRATVRLCTEPVSLSVFDRGAKGVKIVYWYVTRVADGAEKEEDTQMPGEGYVSHFVEAEQAVRMLTVDSQRDVAAQAVELVRATEETLGREVI